MSEHIHLPGSIDFDYAEIYVVNNSNETSIALADTWYQVTVFGNDGQESGANADHTNDHITVATTGIYVVMLSVSLSSGTGSGGVYEGEVQKNDGATRLTNLHLDRQLAGGGGDVGSASISGLASLTANDTIEFWIRCTTATNVLVEDANLSLWQIA